MSQIQTDTPQKFAESFERHLAGVTEVVDLAQMESWLDDELHCKAPEAHTPAAAYGTPCSVHVYYLASSCTSDNVPVCEATRNRYLRMMGAGCICIYCHGRCATFIPV